MSVHTAPGQCDDWRVGPELTDSGYIYRAVVWDADGAGPQPEQLIAAGGFGFAGWPRVVAAQNIASWNGTAWQALGSGIPQLDIRYSPVQAMAVYGGEVVVGGYFTQAGGDAVNNIARWNGTQWRSLAGGVTGTISGSDTPGFVYAMTVFNGELVVVGDFATAGGVVVNGMARWNGASWAALGNGPATEQAAALTVYNNELVAAGLFSQIAGVPANSIARWNGSTWAPLGQGITGTGPGVLGIVRALTLYNGELIAVGEFDTAGGMPASRVAAWNGTSWRPLSGGISGADFPEEAYTAAVFNGDLIVGGHFDHAGGPNPPPAATFNVARWNGSGWSPMSLGLGSPPGFGGYRNEAYTLAPFGSVLIAGGSFYNVAGVRVNGITQWNGSVWQDMPGIVHDMGVIRAMAVFEGTVVAAGAFGLVESGDSQIGYNLSRWDGLALGAGLGNGGGTDGPIDALKSYTAGSGPTLVNNLLIGGEFTLAGDQVLGFVSPANRVALYSSTATTAPTWSAMGSGFNDAVLALERLNFNTYAGGAFTVSGDGATALSRIARFDGTTWQPVGPGPGTGTNGTIRAMKSFSSAMTTVSLVVGGDFTSAGGITASRVATFNQSTIISQSSWNAMGPGLNGTVYAIERFGNSTYAGGAFTATGDGAVALAHVARFDGTTWQPVGAGLNGTVRALLTEGGYLYAAGDFTASGSTIVNHFARWDGSTWNQIHAGTDGTVNALAAYHNEVHVGGSFLTVRNAAIITPAWARYLETGAPWIAEQPHGYARPCGTNFAPDVRPAAGYSVQYQWRKDGVNLVDGPTGTGSTIVGSNGNFAVINVGLDDQGTYDCIISNTCGSDTSQGAP